MKIPWYKDWTPTLPYFCLWSDCLLLVFFCLSFFIDRSMAVAEEHSSLFNVDNQKNCSNSGWPCGSIEDVWAKQLLSNVQLSRLSSSSSTSALLNYLFDFFIGGSSPSSWESESRVQKKSNLKLVPKNKQSKVCRWRKDRPQTLALRGLEEPFFISSCAVVSVFCSGRK